ncbi:MAG TPA: hypothetical protein VIS99_17685 [Terrimicrobiaceae bacterium]
MMMAEKRDRFVIRGPGGGQTERWRKGNGRLGANWEGCRVLKNPRQNKRKRRLLTTMKNRDKICGVMGPFDAFAEEIYKDKV